MPTRRFYLDGTLIYSNGSRTVAISQTMAVTMTGTGYGLSGPGVFTSIHTGAVPTAPYTPTEPG